MTSIALAPDLQDSEHSVSAEMLARFDIAGPRHTSYPTADRFVEAFGADVYGAAATQRRLGASARSPISLYGHIPFCASLCYYCACNKIVTRHESRGRKYLRHLSKEIDLHVARLGPGTPVSQLHLGGGTPTFLSDEDLAHVAHRGFDRLSFGVQDFDPAVQHAVHRIQPANKVFALVASARQLPFQSINVDLIYGLPWQSVVSFDRTLARVFELQPDRIALYAGAHLPDRFKPQRRIATSDLPYAAVKIEMLARSIAALTEAGCMYICMDHIARPDDALAVAKRQGRLHRNFQGYNTQPDCAHIALGVSAIGHVGGTYSQNAKTLDEYYDHLDQGRLPVVRGLGLSRDDVLRRAVIMAILCQGHVDFQSTGIAHLVDSCGHFAAELAALGQLSADGLVQVTDHDLTVPDEGWFCVRAVAMVFDRFLQTDRKRALLPDHLKMTGHLGKDDDSIPRSKPGRPARRTRVRTSYDLHCRHARNPRRCFGSAQLAPEEPRTDPHRAEWHGRRPAARPAGDRGRASQRRTHPDPFRPALRVRRGAGVLQERWYRRPQSVDRRRWHRQRGRHPAPAGPGRSSGAVGHSLHRNHRVRRAHCIQARAGRCKARRHRGVHQHRRTARARRAHTLA